jgi:hypothetical protein
MEPGLIESRQLPSSSFTSTFFIKGDNNTFVVHVACVTYFAHLINADARSPGNQGVDSLIYVPVYLQLRLFSNLLLLFANMYSIDCGLTGHHQVYKFFYKAAAATTAASFLGWHCTALMHVFNFVVLLVNLFSYSDLWQF